MKLQEIKDKLWGKRQVRNEEGEAGDNKLLVEFAEMYMTLYEESMDFLQEVIRRVRKQFNKKKNREEFNFTKQMYTAQHQDDLDEND